MQLNTAVYHAMSTTTQKILTLEIIAVFILIGIIWMNEWLDMPYLLLGAEATPLNYREAAFETLCVLGVCVPLVLFNARILKKIDRVASLLPTCTACKKIHDDRELWTLLESCVQSHGSRMLTNGICLECLKKYYPEMYDAKIKQDKRDTA